jgi:hypothetical protein
VLEDLDPEIEWHPLLQVLLAHRGRGASLVRPLLNFRPSAAGPGSRRPGTPWCGS